LSTVARRFESRVFFPWERKRGLLGFVGRARVRIVLFAIATIVVLVVIHRREEHAAAVRSTRATITTASRAVASWRADHGEHGTKCPADLLDVVRAGYARELPIDAWGHPLRLECPSRRGGVDFDLSSDGPDGIYGGLDRVQ
jgi:general secretion pathway protein G